jgi:uncharacterized membrane protein YhhN
MLSCVRLGRRWTGTAAAAIAVADAALAASRSPRSRRARVLTKPALLPALATATRVRGHRPSGPVGVALAASWLGDVALLSRSDPALLGGIAGFAVAHLSYLVEIRRRFPGPTPRPEGIAVTAVFGAVLTGAGTVLWRRLDTERPLRVPVLGYATLVTGLGAAAVRAAVRTPGPAGRALAAGGTLFVVSDGLIAATMFGDRRRPAAEAAVMATYAAAQALLVTALTDRPTTAQPNAPGT